MTLQQQVFDQFLERVTIAISDQAQASEVLVTEHDMLW